MSTVTVRGVALDVREAGDGEPVVFVHGSGSDRRMWDPQLIAVGAGRRAIAYSRRYAWPNDDITPGADDPMEVHVDDLLALLQALEAAPAHLVGHSWGGMISLLATIREPRAVRSLVLAEPPVVSLFVSTPPRPREVLSLALRRPRTAAAIVRFGAGAFAPAQRAYRRGDDGKGFERFARGILGRDGFERLDPARLEQARANAGAMRAQVLGQGFPPLDGDDVRRVGVPVLLVTGERSRPLFHRLTDVLAEMLPHAERVTIPGASHGMAEERPAAFSEAVLTFLARAAARC